jgi:hypothetical protein
MSEHMMFNIAYRRRIPSILRRISISKATLTLFAAAVHCFGAPGWIAVQTAHFNIYSTYSAKQTERYAEKLELARQFLATTIGTSSIPTIQNIITVRSRQDYVALSGSDNTIGNYIRNNNSSYLMYTEIGLETNEQLFHELARSILTRAYPGLPWCITQGMADVYATNRISKHEIKYGGENVIHAMEAWAEADDAVHLRDLLQIDSRQLDELNAPTFRIVAGESWAFAQMLMLSDQYSERFPEFLEEIHNGADVATGLSRVFRKSLYDVAHDLNTYILRGRFESAHVQTRAVQGHSQVIAMSASDVNELKAEVQAIKEHPEVFAQQHESVISLQAVPDGRNRTTPMSLSNQSTPRTSHSRSGDDVSRT